jgi:hypothetical protein
LKLIEKPKLGLHLAESAYALLVLVWYLLPFFDPSLEEFSPFKLADALYGSSLSHAGDWLLVTILIYVVPVISVWKIASVFLDSQISHLTDPDRLVPIFFNLLSSGIVVALIVLHLVNQAHSFRYFAALPPFTYVVGTISIAYNGFFIIMAIANNSRRNAAYREYLEFRKTSEEGSGGVLSIIQHRGIQRTLILTFVPLILVIIVVLALVLLRDFRGTINQAVRANGQGIADRTASVVKANPGDKDRISLDDYFAEEWRKNYLSAWSGAMRAVHGDMNNFTSFLRSLIDISSNFGNAAPQERQKLSDLIRVGLSFEQVQDLNPSDLAKAIIDNAVKTIRGGKTKV